MYLHVIKVEVHSHQIFKLQEELPDFLMIWCLRTRAYPTWIFRAVLELLRSLRDVVVPLIPKPWRTMCDQAGSYIPISLKHYLLKRLERLCDGYILEYNWSNEDHGNYLWEEFSRSKWVVNATPARKWDIQWMSNPSSEMLHAVSLINYVSKYVLFEPFEQNISTSSLLQKWELGLGYQCYQALIYHLHAEIERNRMKPPNPNFFHRKNRNLETEPF